MRSSMKQRAECYIQLHSSSHRLLNNLLPHHVFSNCEEYYTGAVCDLLNNTCSFCFYIFLKLSLALLYLFSGLVMWIIVSVGHLHKNMI